MTDQYPIFEYSLNLKTSVTKDEAVAKMLGLMRGAVRGPESNQIEADLSYIPELIFDLEDYFVDMRERLTYILIKVFESSSTDEEKAAAYYDLHKCDQLIKKAGEYKNAIDLEISYGEASKLKLDQKQTKQSGEDYIYLASLDEWVKQKYQFSIYPDSNLNINNPELITLDYQNSGTVEAIVMDDISYAPELRARTIDSIKLWVKSNKLKGYSDLETNNLLITFFASLFDIAKFKGENKPKNLKELVNAINVSGTAETLSRRIIDTFEDVVGQSSEAIRSRIEDAKQAALNTLNMRE